MLQEGFNYSSMTFGAVLGHNGCSVNGEGKFEKSTMRKKAMNPVSHLRQNKKVLSSLIFMTGLLLDSTAVAHPYPNTAPLNLAEETEIALGECAPVAPLSQEEIRKLGANAYVIREGTMREINARIYGRIPGDSADIYCRWEQEERVIDQAIEWTRDQAPTNAFGPLEAQRRLEFIRKTTKTRYEEDIDNRWTRVRRPYHRIFSWAIRRTPLQSAWQAIREWTERGCTVETVHCWKIGSASIAPDVKAALDNASEAYVCGVQLLNCRKLSTLSVLDNQPSCPAGYERIVDRDGHVQNDPQDSLPSYVWDIEGANSADPVNEFCRLRQGATPPPAIEQLPRCDAPEQDADGDEVKDSEDGCPFDPRKSVDDGACNELGDSPDTDGDGSDDLADGCRVDPLKTSPGICGCGVSDADDDGDGTVNCQDICPNDSAKVQGGECGCGVADTDTDGDGIADCLLAYTGLDENGFPTVDVDAFNVQSETEEHCSLSEPGSCLVEALFEEPKDVCAEDEISDGDKEFCVGGHRQRRGWGWAYNHGRWGYYYGANEHYVHNNQNHSCHYSSATTYTGFGYSVPLHWCYHRTVNYASTNRDRPANSQQQVIIGLHNRYRFPVRYRIAWQTYQYTQGKNRQYQARLASWHWPSITTRALEALPALNRGTGPNYTDGDYRPVPGMPGRWQREFVTEVINAAGEQNLASLTLRFDSQFPETAQPGNLPMTMLAAVTANEFTNGAVGQRLNVSQPTGDTTGPNAMVNFMVSPNLSAGNQFSVPFEDRRFSVVFAADQMGLATEEPAVQRTRDVLTVALGLMEPGSPPNLTLLRPQLHIARWQITAVADRITRDVAPLLGLITEQAVNGITAESDLSNLRAQLQNLQDFLLGPTAPAADV